MAVRIIIPSDAKPFVDYPNAYFTPPLFLALKGPYNGDFKSIDQSDVHTKFTPIIIPKSVRNFESTLWKLLHLWTTSYPSDTQNYLFLMTKYYRCGGCRKDLIKWMENNPIHIDKMDQWMTDYHNHVNETIQKPKYKHGLPDQKEGIRSVHDGFIHFVDEVCEIFIPLKS